jgi:hypothetical protein
MLPTVEQEQLAVHGPFHDRSRKRRMIRHSSQSDLHTNQIRLTHLGRKAPFAAGVSLATAYEAFLQSLEIRKGQLVYDLHRLVRKNGQTESR